jgi:hypothetical protein
VSAASKQKSPLVSNIKKKNFVNVSKPMQNLHDEYRDITHIKTPSQM